MSTAIASRAINRERAMTPELTFSVGALVRRFADFFVAL
jgi:hypothetical protein